MESFLTSSFNWWICSESCWINLLRYVFMSKRSYGSCFDLEKSMSLIALTFSGSGEILSFPIFCVPKILVWSLQNQTCPCLLSNVTSELWSI